MKTRWAWIAVVFLAITIPALAQVDFVGEWAPRFHEDQPERIPGPALGDYLGLPINDALRLRADSWDADLISMPERQCNPHPATYSFRGPANLRVSKEADPVTQDIVSYTIYGTFGRATRVIWMDGRPHPSASAAHTWAGFSTGKWEGGILTVETSHLKAGYLRRNGVIHSDLATMTEHFIRHADHLTIVTLVVDPVYLTEPFIRTTDFVMDLGQHESATPCDVAIEALRPNGAVPHHLPGANPFLTGFATGANLPQGAARGGAQTMYPEYRLHMNTAIPAPPVFATESLVGNAGENAPVEILPVRGNIYMLVAGGGNITLSLGPEGVLLVDTAVAALADNILAEIRKVTAKPIRYVLNTSADQDHTGGNAFFAKIGRPIGAGGAGSALFADIAETDPRAEIYAHLNVLDRMSDLPASAWPTITYFNDRKELFFNDEAVQILHLPSAHSDGDSIVFFRRSDVVSTGDIFDTVTYPIIDLAKGGSIQGEIDGLNRILDITIPAAQQEGGTMVIPGHGRLCDEADVVEYRDMVTILRDRILDMKSRGMTLDQVKVARPTRDYDGRYGATTGPWTTDAFVEAVYRSVPASK
jgi:glyoxylase-like metal-dependent hydrolase (beta-lactamase superfamily II)